MRPASARSRCIRLCRSSLACPSWVFTRCKGYEWRWGLGFARVGWLEVVGLGVNPVPGLFIFVFGSRDFGLLWVKVKSPGHLFASGVGFWVREGRVA